jgi:hypothetical protein
MAVENAGPRRLALSWRKPLPIRLRQNVLGQGRLGGRLSPRAADGISRGGTRADRKSVV